MATTAIETAIHRATVRTTASSSGKRPLGQFPRAVGSDPGDGGGACVREMVRLREMGFHVPDQVLGRRYRGRTRRIPGPPPSAVSGCFKPEAVSSSLRLAKSYLVVARSLLKLSRHLEYHF